VLSEQMQSNQEEGGQTAMQQQDDMSQVTDPLGLGVLNQTTFQLEAGDDSAQAGTTRRQLHKLQRYQAGMSMMGDAQPSTSQQVRARTADGLHCMFW
jgi:hypothetical protein